ncbi:MAG: hypothetical protein RLZZ453_1232 [Chlamydiota bacterium]
MLGIFLDTETNGLDLFEHKVIEIAFDLVDLNSGALIDTFHATVACSSDEWKKSDPESLKINGFSWDEVSQGTPRHQVGLDIEKFFIRYQLKRKQAIFICQNPSFDRIFFSQLVCPGKQEALLFPYHWLDLASMFFARTLTSSNTPLPWDIGYSKDMIAAFYKIPPEEKPHRAVNGVRHLLACYTQVVGFPKRPS